MFYPAPDSDNRSSRGVPALWVRLYGMLLGIMLAHHAIAIDTQTSWHIDDLATSPGDPVELRDRSNRLRARIPASTIRFLYIVTQDLMKSAEISADLYVTTGATPNAAAGVIEGRNTVLVNIGMLKMIGPDMHQWAAVIGHEIAHIKLAHMDKQVARKGPLMVLEAIVQSQVGPAYRQVTDVAFQAFETKYGRDAERESDYLGAIWAVEAGYNPYGGVLVHEGLIRLGNSHPVPFLSSHPSSAERISSLKALSARLGGTPYKVDDDR